MSREKKVVTLIFAVLLLFSIVLQLSGCSSNGGKSTNTTSSSDAVNSQSSSNVLVTSGDRVISLSVPTGWNINDTKLWPGAEIGVSNDANSEYLVVTRRIQYDIGKNSTINDYLTVVKNVFSTILDNPVWGSTSDITLSGCKGLATQVSGTKKSDKSGVVYFVNVLLSTKTSYFYNVCGWTVSSMADTNKASLQNIIISFKETWPVKPTTK
jgi:hypothetical protein